MLRLNPPWARGHSKPIFEKHFVLVLVSNAAAEPSLGSRAFDTNYVSASPLTASYMLLQRSGAIRLGVGKFANDSASAEGICVTRPGLGKFDKPGCPVACSARLLHSGVLLQRSCATRLGVGKFANDSAAAGGICVTLPGLGKFDKPGSVNQTFRGFVCVGFECCG